MIVCVISAIECVQMDCIGGAMDGLYGIDEMDGSADGIDEEINIGGM